MKLSEIIHRSTLAAAVCAALLSTGCRPSSSSPLQGLESEIAAAVDTLPCKIGVAVIYDSRDTMTYNNSADFPMMSMFKLHEAVAVCRELDRRGTTLDSLLTINRADLDSLTWSPMLKEFSGESFTVSLGTLLDYTLIHSDNNASNLLFDRIIGPMETDSCLRTVISDHNFAIRHTEATMKLSPEPLSYENATSPLAYACLINKVMTDTVTSAPNQTRIIDCMRRCDTGLARIAASLPDSVSFAHRTGSGYINSRGEVTAVNDGGYVTLPDGRSYTIAVFVKDYAGPQEDAEKAITEVSGIIYRRLAAAR